MKKKNIYIFYFVFFISFLNIKGWAQNIYTIAGTSGYLYNGDGIFATSARIGPTGIAFDANGNLFIADWQNHRIRKVNSSGVISTVAGNGLAGFSGDGGPATTAELNYPVGITFDLAGNLFISDQFNNRIRKVDINGIISTVAGNGTTGYSGDGGLATLAQLTFPGMLAVNNTGDLFIADASNNAVRKVNASGIISTVAGTGIAGFSGDGGPATAAKLNYCWGIAFNSSGELFISERDNNRIRKVDGSGIITTVVGTGTSGFNGDGGPFVNAELAGPHGIVFDASDNLFIADDGNNRVRMVNISDTISTVAGNGTMGFSGDGGAATSAKLNVLRGLACNVAGCLFIVDAQNYRIRQVTTQSGCSSPSFSLTASIIANNMYCGNGPCNGSVTLNVVNGIPPYTYLWSTTQTTQTLTGLCAGNYSVLVTDNVSNTTTASVLITNNPLPTVSYNESQTNLCTNSGVQTLTAGTPNGGIYSGTAVTGNTFNATTAGVGIFPIVYTYTDINGCSNSDTSYITVNLCSGIESSLVELNFSIFPNPNSGKFMIDSDITNSRVEIYNSLGEKIYCSKLIASVSEIELSSKAKGVYFLRVIKGEEIITKKIVIE